MASGEGKIPDAVQWHEGMFLAPQHFQQADQRQEALAALHATHASPYHWGVRELAFDSVQLAGGTLRVTRLSAILPDGLVVEYDPALDEDLVLDLKALHGHGETFPVLVHLTVPRVRDPDQPVAGSLSRYRSVETRHVVDENTGEDALAIPRLRPRLALFAGESVPEKYVGIPIARVVQHADSYALADFVPPHVRLAVAPGLVQAVSARAARLRERAVFLSDQLRKTGLDESDPTVQRTVRQITGLVHGLPVLEAVIQSERAHPFQLYLAIAGYLGGVAEVRPGYVSPSVPAYDHDDLFSTFTPLLRALDEILRLVHQAFRTVSFAEGPDGYEVDVPAEAGSPLLVGVRAGATLTGEALTAWIR
ncbi:MAG: hypothetical protein D6701_09065, partial [Gemmatimonadetes bacterium]